VLSRIGNSAPTKVMKTMLPSDDGNIRIASGIHADRRDRPQHLERRQQQVGAPSPGRPDQQAEPDGRKGHARPSRRDERSRLLVLMRPELRRLAQPPTSRQYLDGGRHGSEGHRPPGGSRCASGEVPRARPSPDRRRTGCRPAETRGSGPAPPGTYPATVAAGRAGSRDDGAHRRHGRRLGQRPACYAGEIERCPLVAAAIGARRVSLQEMHSNLPLWRRPTYRSWWAPAGLMRWIRSCT
jgi:hypothetical protein